MTENHHHDRESTARRPDGQPLDAGTIARRRYLQLLAAAGAVGLGTASGVASADHDTGPVEITEEDESDWEARADERIQEYRTTDLAVEVIDEDGNPVEGADVAVEMQRHDYGFGTAVNAQVLVNETGPGDEYREYVPALFNKAVLENRHKWRFWEEQTELADAATDWLLDQGLDLRGHVCVWGNRDAYAVPADVEDAVDAGDGEYVRQRSLEHVESIISHYADYGDRGSVIEEWEVVNEVIHEPELIEAVDGVDVDPVEAPVLAEWYQRAQDVRPDDVSLAVNDYNTLAGPWDYARDDYERQIQHLQGNGVDLGGIGMQCHFNADERLEPVEILEGLNRYAGYGAALRITEFDTYQGNWNQGSDSADQQKADYLYRFLKTVFSHPATADFVMWGFWDGEHWGDDAPLFYEDWSPKPGYDVYTGLVFGEWWTDEIGATDADGRYETTAFLGEHEITASTADGTGSATVSLTDNHQSYAVTVTVTPGDGDGDGGGDGDGDETPPTFDSLSAAATSTNNNGSNKQRIDEVTFDWSTSDASAEQVDLEVRDDGDLVGSATVGPDDAPETIVLDASVRTNGPNGADVVATVVDADGNGERCEGFLDDTGATIGEGDFSCTTI